MRARRTRKKSQDVVFLNEQSKSKKDEEPIRYTYTTLDMMGGEWLIKCQFLEGQPYPAHILKEAE